MHTIKVVLELLLTLAVMRAVSWAIGCVLFRVSTMTPLPAAIVANVVALVIFTAFLVYNLLPGEPFDLAAFTFGLVVYAACLLVDLRWHPCRRPIRT